MSEAVIRPAREADCAAVARMMHALAAQSGLVSGTTPAILAREAFGARPTISILVAEIAGEAVGCLIHQPTFSTWSGQNGVFVADFFVEAAHRGRGIGRALLAEAARTGEAGGARFMRLDVEPQNEAARRLYERMGFRERDLLFLKLDAAGMAALAAG